MKKEDLENFDIESLVCICRDENWYCPMFYYNDEGYPHTCNLEYKVDTFEERDLQGTKFENFVKFSHDNVKQHYLPGQTEDRKVYRYFVASKNCKLEYWINNGKKEYPKRLDKSVPTD